MTPRAAHAVPIEQVEVSVYTIPTDAPESDGTLAWDSTTLVLVTVRAGGHTGLGYTYAGPAAAAVVTGTLADVVRGRDALTPPASWNAMQQAVRNLGKPGLVAEALSAVDIALWDLHAQLLDVPLTVALGAVRDATPIYGSGGFTSYDDDTLARQLAGWVDAGIPRVKMKVGRDPEADRGPAGMDITAGEYGYHLPYFHHMLEAGAVDCLQADVTRALGITGVLRVAALCDARGLDLSLHCAPQVSAHVGAAIWHLRHLEYFHDHVRVEAIAFDGVLRPQAGGTLRPDRSRPGLGLQAKTADLQRYRVS